MVILKVGGGRSINLEGIADDLARLDEAAVVVHGAHAFRDDLARRLGAAVRVVTSPSGFASVLSDDALIDLMMMAYAGLRNKRLVEACWMRGVRAVGLTGLDGALIRGRRTGGIRYCDHGRIMIARDHSGRPYAVNLDLLRLLLRKRYLPILTVPIADERGAAINSDNDEIVVLLAATLRAERVIQLIEAPGILADPGDPESRIPRLARRDLAALEVRLGGRMKRKIRCLGRLFEHGPMTVHVADGRTPAPIRGALDGAGTVITGG